MPPTKKPKLEVYGPLTLRDFLAKAIFQRWVKGVRWTKDAVKMVASILTTKEFIYRAFYLMDSHYESEECALSLFQVLATHLTNLIVFRFYDDWQYLPQFCQAFATSQRLKCLCLNAVEVNDTSIESSIDKASALALVAQLPSLKKIYLRVGTSPHEIYPAGREYSMIPLTDLSRLLLALRHGVVLRQHQPNNDSKSLDLRLCEGSHGRQHQPNNDSKSPDLRLCEGSHGPLFRNEASMQDFVNLMLRTTADNVINIDTLNLKIYGPFNPIKPITTLLGLSSLKHLNVKRVLCPAFFPRSNRENVARTLERLQEEETAVTREQFRNALQHNTSLEELQLSNFLMQIDPPFFRDALFPALALRNRQADDRKPLHMTIRMSTLADHTEASIRSFWNAMCEAIASPSCDLEYFYVTFGAAGWDALRGHLDLCQNLSDSLMNQAMDAFQRNYTLIDCLIGASHYHHDSHHDYIFPLASEYMNRNELWNEARDFVPSPSAEEDFCGFKESVLSKLEDIMKRARDFDRRDFSDRSTTRPYPTLTLSDRSSFPTLTLSDRSSTRIDTMAFPAFHQVTRQFIPQIISFSKASSNAAVQPTDLC